MCRKIRLLEANAKCRRLKTYPLKGLCGRFFSVWGPEPHTPPPPPHTHTVYLYIVYLFTQGRGGGFNQREGEKGNSSQNWFENTNTLWKRVSHFPVPSWDVTDQTLSGREKTKLFPPRKSLISDIPAGDGKTANSFLQCMTDCISNL